MKTRLLLPLLLLLATTSSWAQTQTAVVRGRLTHGAFPATYVQVTIYNQSTPRSAPAVTGQDGMYIFPKIPVGDYYLEVWADPKTPLVYPIHVAYPATDIPPINIP